MLPENEPCGVVYAIIWKFIAAQNAHYVNYIDSTITNWQQGYYGLNYKRLQAIKSKVDPQDMFTYPIQGIKGSKQKACTMKPCEASSF